MATTGSSFTPTPIGREESVGVGHHLRPNALQWRTARFNFSNPEAGGAAGDLAYLKGHLLGRARDGFGIFGSALVQDTATDFEQLKAALTKNFPVVRKRKDLEIQFYSSQQNRDQEPTHFIYDLLNVHIFVRLEPQV
ncbi:uncharacterized protein TNCV_4721491 [Trichonephila clavipes]|uniref:Uncharacterized protein n=1 Tax=Trichonephila clavipes TaxID=2585209 RepID=A0A8X6W7C2_TRICX|nr:uncharacterized protein TNCV_4721491 [Trichonephila clavipes]